MNNATITGNVVDTPKAVKMDNGRMLADFRMGNNEYVNGETVNNGFFDVTVFGAQAEHVLASVQKGMPLVVTGRLDHRTYEFQPEGSTETRKGSRTRLIAQAVGLSLQYNEGSLVRKQKAQPAAVTEQDVLAKALAKAKASGDDAAAQAIATMMIDA